MGYFSSRERLLKPSRSRLAFLLLGLVAFGLTELGRFVYRPYAWRNHLNDLGLADSVGNLGGTAAQIFLGLAVLNTTRKQSYRMATFFAAGYILYEFAQPHLPKGVFDWKDIYGTLIGFLVSMLLIAAVWKVVEPDRRIRKYDADDLTELLAVWYEASRGAHAFLSSEFFDQERQNIVEQYLPVAETWVYEDRGRVVGFISLIGDEVGAIFVLPEQQRKGVGRALMDHAKGLRNRLVLEVFEANEIGRAFYDSYGFETIGKRVHEETGQPLLRLRLGRPDRPSAGSRG